MVDGGGFDIVNLWDESAEQILYYLFLFPFQQSSLADWSSPQIIGQKTQR